MPVREEMEIAATSDLAGKTLRQAALDETTGALLIAIRSKTGVFVPNPPLDTQVEAGLVPIAAGTLAQLRTLHDVPKTSHSHTQAHGVV